MKRHYALRKPLGKQLRYCRQYGRWLSNCDRPNPYTLNAVARKDSYRTGNALVLLDSLHGAKWFTTFDLFSGYYNKEVAEEDKDKTAYIVPGSPGGIYHFERLSFGLCNAPATLCRDIDQVVGNLKYKCVLPYYDDFIVLFETSEEHLEHISLVTHLSARIVRPRNSRFKRVIRSNRLLLSVLNPSQSQLFLFFSSHAAALRSEYRRSHSL